MAKTLFLFRNDLRLDDNPAYLAACDQGEVLPVYILDDLAPQKFAMGSASRLWLYHSLQSLQKSLEGHLVLEKGAPETILLRLVEEHKIDAVFLNTSIIPWYRKFDRGLRAVLDKKGVVFATFDG
ncbi:MAG: deoxyribodipyrimidine photo-lyase, partial [Chlamydiota bacterium]